MTKPHAPTTSQDQPPTSRAEAGMTAFLLALDTLAFFVPWVGIVGLVGWDPGAESPGDSSAEYGIAALIAALIGAASTWFVKALGFRTATAVHAVYFTVIVLVFAAGAAT
ncbi:hypothetical protein [Streptomyces apocyni]|uniref:hypothetical protein n=1 Tax=Streptomyces apocyni TaxID=2654677 RepID=UPI0012E9FFA5|nr:hypothetical protein [Streptomyces apocyni]